MKRATIVVAAVAFLVTWPVRSHAQDKGAASGAAHAKPEGQILKVGEITIVGRVQKPIAAVDVAKIQPKLTLAELRQPFLDRIEEAVHKDPF
jgi:hypothetical protein